MKRAIDFVLAATGILLTAPLMLVLMFAIFLDSGSPTLFQQDRVGKNRKVFTCFKLRTMPQSTANVASHQLPDVEMTKLGRFLRRFKLDELPQLVNVLLGQMSLVGPRPCLPTQSQLIELRSAKHIFDLRPGITGLAQINDVDMSDPVRLVSFEEKYLAQSTLVMDFRILTATLTGSGMQTDAAQKHR